MKVREASVFAGTMIHCTSINDHRAWHNVAEISAAVSALRGSKKPQLHRQADDLEQRLLDHVEQCDSN